VAQACKLLSSSSLSVRFGLFLDENMKNRHRIGRYLAWIATLPLFCHGMGFTGCNQHLFGNPDCDAAKMVSAELVDQLNSPEVLLNRD
jgi:hypothetical protein